MIQESVQKLADEFTQWWKPFHEGYSQLELDYTWPSVGVIDALLFPVRRAEELEDYHRYLLAASGAYLGVMAYRCWSKFPNVELSLYQTDYGIYLETTGGEFLSANEKVSIDLTQKLYQAVCTPPNPLPTCGKYMRQDLTEVSNVLSFVGNRCIVWKFSFCDWPME